jgi:hypothetical protein
MLVFFFLLLTDMAILVPEGFESAYRGVLSFGPSCRMQALVRGGGVHVVRCAGLLGYVGDGGAL